ncbi:MAG: DnaT-like ssDNA-binding domain-containing protein [Marinobacterium sp.]|nr:DnaT-like ssDNA-binding domain-containing protein [Marinobacterium sp.]
MALVPEQPFLIYPSQIQLYGLEGALLLQRYQQLLAMLITEPDQPVAIVISRQQWLQLVPFWDEDQLAIATGHLVANQAIDVGFLDDGQVQISYIWHISPAQSEQQRVVVCDDRISDDNVAVQSSLSARNESSSLASNTAVSGMAIMPGAIAVSPEPAAPLSNTAEAIFTGESLASVKSGVSREAVVTGKAIEESTVAEVIPATPRVMRRRISSETLMQQRGPAPTFGGSTGWRRPEAQQAEESDELHQVFHMREEHNQKLHSMFMGWKPSDTFFELLPRHGIPNEYAEECLDEFTLYWLDKDRKESNWDQKFLAWVKREWIRKQTREARQRNQGSSETTPGVSGHENTRRDTRENRKRVTAAIMDVRDTDW